MQGLLQVEDGDFSQRTNGEFAVVFGDDVNVRVAGKPFADALPAGRNLDGGHGGQYYFPALGKLPPEIGRRCYAPERWLHRAGGDFEGLEEERADTHGNGE